MTTVVIANIIDFLAAVVQVGSGAIKEKTKILIEPEHLRIIR